MPLDDVKHFDENILVRKHFSRQADGFHARAVQHECDHLDGILYPMRMDDLSLFGFAEEVNRNRNLLARPNPEPEEEPNDQAEDQREAEEA